VAGAVAGALGGRDGGVVGRHAFAQAADVAQRGGPVAVPDEAQVVVGLGLHPLAQRQHQRVGLVGRAGLAQVAGRQRAQAHQLFLRPDAPRQRDAFTAHGQRFVEGAALAQQVGQHARGAHTLEVVAGVPCQRTRLGQRGGVGAGADERRHPRGERLESLFGRAGFAERSGGLALQIGFFGLACCGAGTHGGLHKGACGLQRLAASLPMPRHARRSSVGRMRPWMRRGSSAIRSCAALGA
jgi:hypothetical protein